MESHWTSEEFETKLSSRTFKNICYIFLEFQRSVGTLALLSHGFWYDNPIELKEADILLCTSPHEKHKPSQIPA